MSIKTGPVTLTLQMEYLQCDFCPANTGVLNTAQVPGTVAGWGMREDTLSAALRTVSAQRGGRHNMPEPAGWSAEAVRGADPNAEYKPFHMCPHCSGKFAKAFETACASLSAAAPVAEKPPRRMSEQWEKYANE